MMRLKATQPPSFQARKDRPQWRIGVLATRLAGVDGVTLETRKWVRVLRDMGHQVFFLAGRLEFPFLPGMEDPLLHFKHPYVQELHRAFYQDVSGPTGPLLSHMERLAAYFERRIEAFVRRFGIEILIVQNILALPIHIPLAMGLTWFLYRHPLPTVAHHHDFYWERARFRTARIPSLLETYFPPALPNLWHVVINRAAAQTLRQRKGLRSLVVPNVWDFSRRAPREDASPMLRRLGFSPDDLLILQPTRVVPRKGIEHALELLHRMIYGPWRHWLKGRRPVLVITHPAGDEGWDYLFMLHQRARALRVPLVYLGHHGNGFLPWRIYAQAHAMTYPSLYEGFGNALLEGLHFELPILINRYPVYREEIAAHRFRLVEMEGQITPEVVEAFIEHLLDPRLRREAGEYNKALAHRVYGLHVLQHALEQIFQALASA